MKKSVIIKPINRIHIVDGVILDNKEIQKIIKEKKPISYAKLCDKLEIKRTTGNAKEKQMRQLERVVVYDKIGSKYQIHRFTTEKEFEEFLIHDSYKTLISSFILCHLCNTEGHSIEMTMLELITLCGLVNKNYKYGKYNIAEVFLMNMEGEIQSLNDEEITEDKITTFFESSESIYRERVKSAIENLESQKLIMCTRIYYYIEQRGEYFFSYNFSDSEVSTLLKIQRTLLEEIIKKRPSANIEGISSRTKIQKDRKIRLIDNSYVSLTMKESYHFYYETRRRMLELNEKWKNYSTKYSLIINESAINEVNTYLEDKLKETINKKNINDKKSKITSQTLSYWFLYEKENINIANLLKERKDKEKENQKKLLKNADKILKK